MLSAESRHCRIEASGVTCDAKADAVQHARAADARTAMFGAQAGRVGRDKGLVVVRRCWRSAASYAIDMLLVSLVLLRACVAASSISQSLSVIKRPTPPDELM
jgi:hypothetical protein